MSTIRELVVDLRHAGATVLDEAEKVVSKGALNIKREWRARWDGYPHIKHLPNAISYDTDRTATSVSAEVGPVRGELQAGLAPYIEAGTINNAPIPGMMPAADAEEPRFVKAIADLGEKLLS